MSTFDERKHPRGGDPANPGRWSTKHRAEADPDTLHTAPPADAEIYRDRIRQAVAQHGPADRADNDTAAIIEDCMRTNRSALDGLGPAEFDREAVGFADTLDADTCRELAEAFGTTVPGWAS